ncbi:phosphoribosylamine--glycine ligase [Acetivibrio mesophilus]|uniref:Phosphoribosylamine--glycine ligase n=1 Tax=Acetivibrio mesophilus TaxID=2487273 RepID=A0A4V1K2E6_9FIRM|nr:phosphoribosylamine--glycine ligase [Acetivibrio mesophilus]ODM24983.1 phosphoribosylamine--glycine ligase [Clostridium sp. Bc-iso-3]RXE60019.1 phosphoribosylamine--glycine ligase [Acetivibrio mesophilus]
MKVLVVGSGGREHALVWKIVQSPKIDKVYCAPGNGGISAIAECVPIKAMDIDGVINFSKEKEIDMVVVAPDDPLAAGMVDALENAGIRAFGPNKAAATIEGSKAFAKNLMKKYNIPTANYEVFENSADAIRYLQNQQYPLVVKADGLALGKGVIIAQNFSEAKEAVESIMEDKVFGEAGNKVVIEEFLVGPEVSMLAFTDGKSIKTMVSSQDHKRALDNDQGLNTGGMGTFSPSRIYTEEIDSYCMEKIYKPTIEAMEKEGRKFKGVLYFGLIITKDGPKVLEYNARFGDPETQVVLPRLNTDIIDIFDAIIDERLDEVEISWNDNACVCVIMASGGYPKEYKTGYEISGLADAERDANVVVFHAGTKREDGKYYTAGGRVLGVTAMESNLDEAINKAYEGVGKIQFQDMHYRKDIGIK